MLNHIVIMGRLTRDPELRRTQSGIEVTTITVAVDRDRQNRESGEKQVDFFDVTVWRQTAVFVCNYFSKGRMIVVEGSMQSRKWQDKNGQNRISWEIQANNVYFGDSKRDNQGGGDYAAPSYGAQPYSAPAGGYNAPSSGYNAPAGGYSAPASGYNAPAGGGFSEIEEDGELPF